MANSPRKSKDPTELALSAIEDALNIPHEPAPASGPAAPAPAAPAAPAAGSITINPPRREPRPSRAPRIEPDVRVSAGAPPASAPAAPAAPTQDEILADRLAANENRESVGQLLRALQRRPSRTPHLVAWLFTFAWAVFFAGMVFGTYSTELGEMFAQGFSAVPLAVGLVAGFFAPVVLF